ncbi:MAG: hypothetical protein D3903_13860 [Candidatus Electrothrix sp. GM3_4]|nr:hypothetical protein [Candidatus Electrothrix sp. GM3_4]
MCGGAIRTILGVDEFLEKLRDKSQTIRGKNISYDEIKKKFKEILRIKDNGDFSYRFDNIDKELLSEREGTQKGVKGVMEGSRVGNEISDDMLNEADEDWSKAKSRIKWRDEKQEISEKVFDDVDDSWEKAKKKNKKDKCLSEIEIVRRFNNKYGGKKKSY